MRAGPKERSRSPRRHTTIALGLLAALLLGAAIGRATAGGEETEAQAGDGLETLAGVAVSHPRSPQGAAAAVAAYQRAFADASILAPGVLRRRIEAVASPDYVAAMLAANSPGRARLAQGPFGQGVRYGIPTLYKAVPIGYRVESYSPRRARVLTWGFTLLGNASSIAPRAYFGLTHTDLIWRGRWRIAGTEAAFGPTPRLATPVGPGGGYAVMAIANQLRDYGATP